MDRARSSSSIRASGARTDAGTQAGTAMERLCIAATDAPSLLGLLRLSNRASVAPNDQHPPFPFVSCNSGSSSGHTATQIAEHSTSCGYAAVSLALLLSGTQHAPQATCSCGLVYCCEAALAAAQVCLRAVVCFGHCWQRCI